MKIKIDDLEGKVFIVELEDVGNVFPGDDVIYFDGVPYKLSTAEQPSAGDSASPCPFCGVSAEEMNTLNDALAAETPSA